jgi:protein-S-isoprenylcysteine O-methyltransferase Ste14
VYVGLVFALFVRVQDPARQSGRATEIVATAADVRVVRRQHRVFYALLLMAPLEWWWRNRPSGWGQLAGAATFLAGLVTYRVAGRALGDHLSPLLAPPEPAHMITDGPYWRVRHPMYLGELAMAVGAPWILAAKASALLTPVFAGVLLHRLALEERVLRARLPEYARYAARTYRLIPYVY